MSNKLWVATGFGLGGFVIGWIVTLTATRGSSAFTSPAWQEDIAWQGWFGGLLSAIVTAVVTVGAAWLVFRGTVADSRDSAREGRLVASFDRLIDALDRLAMAREAMEATKAATSAMLRSGAWAVHVRPSEAPSATALSEWLHRITTWRVDVAEAGVGALHLWIAELDRFIDVLCDWHKASHDERRDVSRWTRSANWSEK